MATSSDADVVVSIHRAAAHCDAVKMALLFERTVPRDAADFEERVACWEAMRETSYVHVADGAAVGGVRALVGVTCGDGATTRLVLGAGAERDVTETDVSATALPRGMSPREAHLWLDPVERACGCDTAACAVAAHAATEGVVRRRRRVATATARLSDETLPLEPLDVVDAEAHALQFAALDSASHYSAGVVSVETRSAFDANVRATWLTIVRRYAGTPRDALYGDKLFVVRDRRDGATGTIVGMAHFNVVRAVSKRASPEVNIAQLCVWPTYQGNGVGTRMLALAERVARSLAVPRVVLTLQVHVRNYAAVALYKRHGFKAASLIAARDSAYKYFQRYVDSSDGATTTTAPPPPPARRATTTTTATLPPPRRQTRPTELDPVKDRAAYEEANRVGVEREAAVAAMYAALERPRQKKTTTTTTTTKAQPPL